ncbi:MAG: hypothetical protein MPK62_05170, partial [Alphaproteobacteria bacterium]|nr:hypothetical protein [Alphaproteobacteria bacterium]
MRPRPAAESLSPLLSVSRSAKRARTRKTVTPPRASPAPDSRRPAWRRGLLKLSGELLAGDKKQGLDPNALRWIADDIKTVARAKRQLAVVTGAGNILRGRAAASVGLERSLADGAGMLGTVINALALHGALSTAGGGSLVFSAFSVGNFFGPEGAGRLALLHIS